MVKKKEKEKCYSKGEKGLFSKIWDDASQKVRPSTIYSSLGHIMEAEESTDIGYVV